MLSPSEPGELSVGGSARSRPLQRRVFAHQKTEAKLSIPGLTADASLYASGRAYRAGMSAFGGGVPAAVVAQQLSGCTISCSDWIVCNNKCGAWPPGLSNYQCWLDCLAPTINCLQGCGPIPPTCDDKCAGLDGCNKVACLCRCEGGKLAPGGTKACPSFHCVDLP